MICGTFTLNKVPAADVDNVVAAFQANDPPPTSVTKTPDGAGTFTVVAAWPPCPPGMSHSTDGAAASP